MLRKPQEQEVHNNSMATIRRVSKQGLLQKSASIAYFYYEITLEQASAALGDAKAAPSLKKSIQIPAHHRMRL